MNFLRFFETLIPWFLSHGLRIILILVVAHSFYWIWKISIGKNLENKIRDGVAKEKRKRIQTLISVFSGTFKFLMYISAILMILAELGVKIAPVLASIGLAGLAVGMAAKDIISDFLSGLFIILENQYDIGDKIKVAGIEGEVKEVTLRRTVIEDSGGFLHSIPNSQIKIISKRI